MNRPLVLSVELDRPAGELAALRPGAWRADDPRLERVGSWGGSALAVALLARRERDAPAGPAATGADPPLVVAVGECVRRGLPTAARATIASRGALSGGLAEGQVGGELALRLASVADALELSGRAPGGGGTVLVVDASGGARLESMPELAGLAPKEAWRRARERIGDAAMLLAGPAGERGIPFATLATGSETPSHVGRGGLGAVLGRLGLKAIAITAPVVEPREPDADAAALLAALASSPRLRARGEGGTLELWQAFGAREGLRGRNYAEPVSAEASRRLWNESREAGAGRHGCRGCPTPCGWVFERARGTDGADGGRQGAHFGAAWALGPNLGLERFDDALALLARCDAAGVDAKEAGAVLALRALARETGRTADGPVWGERAGFEAALDALVAAPEDPSVGARGAAALARVLGLEDRLHAVRGQAARPDPDLGSVLGQCVSVGGADPMRSFPFSTAGGMERAQLERLVEGLALPPRAEDPRDPSGKGRLVWWHENLVAAVDASGFCAFSAAGLLADRVCSLEELARWIAPRSLEPRGAGGLLACGASSVLLRRELAARWGAAGDDDLPGWAREVLELPGMLDEYRAARGLDERGAPRPEALALVGTEALREHGLRALPDVPRGAAPAAEPDAPASAGRVSLRGVGPLGERLGGDVTLALALPARVDRVLAELAREVPRAAAFLVREGQPLAAVYRAGRPLGAADLVADGDELDLVVAVSGG